MSFALEVSGDMACFTRPEFKVERVSYDVITPSAARSIFEAIYWKPQMKWVVEKIEVLNPISLIQINRNEVPMCANTTKRHIIATENHQQRSSRLLRDVRYRLTAKIVALPTANQDNSIEKHEAIFYRRASIGQCFTQPYLGCREFAARWHLVEKAELDKPIAESRNLGMMLHDIDFQDVMHPQPKFFCAVMEQGVIQVPSL